MRLAILAFATLVGCSVPAQDQIVRSNDSSEKSWWEWHADKQELDLAVAEAINGPNGGDYAKAISIIRTTNFPAADKDFDVGMLIIGGFDRRESHRSEETLQQGLEMVEKAVMQPGDTRRYAPQQLRLIFERGAGVPPDNIPIDLVVANCWHKLENAGAGDPARCIALRRQRLPHVGQ